MKNYTILSVLVISFLFCNSINAQQIKMFGSKGVWELGGTIFYSNTTPVSNGYVGGSYGMLQFQPTAGYFIRKGLEIGVQPSISALYSSGYSTTSMSLYFAPAYNFIIKGKVYPAIVGLIGYTSYSNTNPDNKQSLGGFAWGFQGGVKINILGNSLLFVGLQYVQTTLNASGSSNRSGNNTLTFGAGWNVFF